MGRWGVGVCVQTNNLKEPNFHTVLSESVKWYDINFVVVWLGVFVNVYVSIKMKHVSLHDRADLDDYGELSKSTRTQTNNCWFRSTSQQSLIIRLQITKDSIETYALFANWCQINRPSQRFYQEFYSQLLVSLKLRSLFKHTANTVAHYMA